jgi:hypothetical protein
MKATATALYPFVPSGPEFPVSVAFFQELGFDKLWENGGLAGLRFGGAYFMLQDIDVPEWQKNQMITFEVDDLDGYWSEIGTKALADRFTGVKLKPPADYPWGREIHIIDPAGTCGRRNRGDADCGNCTIDASNIA